MTNEIGKNFLLYGTAKEIWEATRETYSSSENTSELFEIEAGYMIYAKENFLLLNTSTLSAVIGST
jgi:hypothetical protein